MPSSVHLRPHHHNSRLSTDPLPVYHCDADTDADTKHRRRKSSSWAAISLPGGAGSRRSRRTWLPDIRRIHQVSYNRYGRRRGSVVVFGSYLGLFLFLFALFRLFTSRHAPWPLLFGASSSTLVFHLEDLQRIWLWEIASGHHPSRNNIPPQLAIHPLPNNPARPHNAGTGVRTYFNVASRPPNVAYPPRPVLGSTADLDILFDHCDFGTKKYVRDCLEFLRVGAGLDNGNRVRRDVSDLKYIFVTEDPSTNAASPITRDHPHSPLFVSENDQTLSSFVKSRYADWEPTPITLPQAKAPSSRPYCDSEEPRIFHMYWTGSFTDKPYLAVLSFLFTQNLGLNGQTPSCPSKLWLWINPNPAILNPTGSARDIVLDQVRLNKWAAPFLHPRFKELVEFKLWNTMEQLDSVNELRDDWRRSKSLFNSGGHTFIVPQDGSSGVSSDLSDRLSVVMSDMARFVLCHRFGGVYLDADTLFLRDWEELWGWKGAFAYRWSFHDKYNTAVLRMNKGSALGTFILRTALKNGLDFHPMEVSKYLRDARLEELLYRLPDALFDSAWLNMEGYQRERPPQPFFSKFAEFFDTPLVNSATPQAIGFDGFFKGAFSYHFHNSWWRRVDPSRDWPDLGPQFDAPERSPLADQRDLDWSAVLKRTFEAYIRGERPNMYGEWIQW